MLAIFAALHHSQVRVVLARGGLIDYRSLLDSPFLYVPHDAVVPGALTSGDLEDLLAVLAPRAVRLEGPVDGLNRRLTRDALAERLLPVRRAFAAAQAEAQFAALVEYGTDADSAAWMLGRLQ